MNAAPFEPYVIDLGEGFQVEDAFPRFATRPHCVFLDSARRVEQLGRYSYLAADPVAWSAGTHELSDVSLWLQQAQTPAVPGLPPFQGGAMGLLSYDLGKRLERIPSPRYNEFPLPEFAVGLYDVVIAVDHEASRAWLISQGLPEQTVIRRRERARRRAEEVAAWLQVEPRPLMPPEPVTRHPDATHILTDIPGVFSNFQKGEYERTVARAIEYIRAGDVFQVNLAQRLLSMATTDSVTLYQQMRTENAAPFAAYLDLGEAQIVSASPERFLRVHEGHVEARPIKGTRQRRGTPEADLFTGAELVACAKDVAENVMIVDLMRNDLSLICEDASVDVTQLCGLEPYEYVQHLVSAVAGKIRPEVTPLDVIRATFPGGSITGAPKVRAMQLISELEPSARNAYCGALGYWGLDGGLDLNILIRTITASCGWWQFPVGGGIVSQSDPELEYQETLIKAEGMLRAVARCQALGAASAP